MRATLKVVLLCGVLFAGLGGVAGASTVISPESGTSYPYQRWVDRAKAPTPDVTLTVVETLCPSDVAPVGQSAPACTRNGDLTIWISLPAERRAIVKRTFFHELGHNFDYYELTVADRAAFLALVGGTAWREPGPLSPHELFAEAYRFCAQGGWRRSPDEAPPVSRPQMASTCYLIRH